MAIVLKENGKVQAFNVTQAVGKGKASQWTDCMLVLYLAHRYAAFTMDTDHGMGMPKFDPNRDYNNIKVVSDAILGFQTHCCNNGTPLKMDGKVHRPPNWHTDRFSYTIGILNIYFDSAASRFFGSRGSNASSFDSFEFALEDNFMPTMLRGQLLASWAFQGVV